MTWFDIVAFALVALVAWLESIRGFGRSLVDLVGAIIIIKLVPVIAGPLGEGLRLMGDANANKALAYAISFLLLGTLVILVSRLIYTSTLLSLEYLDPVVGAFLGLFSGLIVAHAFLHTLQLGYGATEAGKQLLGCFMGQELLEFRSFHIAWKALSDLGR